MSISISTRQAYSEVDEFIELLTEDQKRKIPWKLRQYFKDEKDNQYTKGIKVDIPVKEQNLKEETLAIIALLNLKYWCEDETEKKRLQKVYNQNEILYQEKLREKYNPDNIFKKEEKAQIKEPEKRENQQMVEYKENKLKKIINKILQFLRIN